VVSFAYFAKKSESSDRILCRHVFEQTNALDICAENVQRRRVRDFLSPGGVGVYGFRPRGEEEGKREDYDECVFERFRVAFSRNFDQNERVVVSPTGAGAFSRIRTESLGDSFLPDSFRGHTNRLGVAVSVDFSKELSRESV
jgi:hypothetical protein